jgi:hypothetical protein
MTKPHAPLTTDRSRKHLDERESLKLILVSCAMGGPSLANAIAQTAAQDDGFKLSLALILLLRFNFFFQALQVLVEQVDAHK